MLATDLTAFTVLFRDSVSVWFHFVANEFGLILDQKPCPQRCQIR